MPVPLTYRGGPPALELAELLFPGAALELELLGFERFGVDVFGVDVLGVDEFGVELFG